MSQYAGARQGIFTSFWPIMLILIVDGGHRTRRRDERGRRNFDSSPLSREEDVRFHEKIIVAVNVITLASVAK